MEGISAFNLYLVGAGAKKTILDGDGAGTVFTVPQGKGAVLTDLTLTGGNAGNGGGFFVGGALTLERCAVRGNTAGSGGGGSVGGLGDLTLSATSVSANSANSGAGLFNQNKLTINGGSVIGGKKKGQGNVASGDAGGIYNGGTTSLEPGCKVTGNRAPAGMTGGVVNLSCGECVTFTGPPLIVKNTPTNCYHVAGCNN